LDCTVYSCYHTHDQHVCRSKSTAEEITRVCRSGTRETRR